MRSFALAILALFAGETAAPAAAEDLTLRAVNSASFAGSVEDDADKKPKPFVIRVQVLLDRANISPGAIDGFRGENLTKAVKTFEEREGLEPDGEIDAEFWAVLQQDTAPVLETYKITDADHDGGYVEDIPEDYAEMAKMDWLGFRGPSEMLAERFHMDEDLLKALNPDVSWSKTGSEIVVVSPGENRKDKVTRVIVDRSGGRLLAYDERDELVVAYPATIGSSDNPTPSGQHRVKVAIKEPTYSYNPDVNFQQGENTEPFELPAGPNGPIGLVWIDLSKPTYGIHGTPEPQLVGKSPSHGCVRLTNWDAQELADLVEPGVPVEFR